jgi:hypothetical protein
MKIFHEIKECLDSEDRKITQRVYDKSIDVVSKMNPKYFELNHDCYGTKYKTLVIDFYDDVSELSLEIGYKDLGYFTDGKLFKEVDLIDIENDNRIDIAVKQIEEDLDKLFKNGR